MGRELVNLNQIGEVILKGLKFPFKLLIIAISHWLARHCDLTNCALLSMGKMPFQCACAVLSITADKYCTEIVSEITLPLMFDHHFSVCLFLIPFQILAFRSQET